MILKKSFNETIIYKKSNELKKKIEALNKLHNEFPGNEKISIELKKCNAGLYGENEIIYELNNSNIGMYVLHDINICIDDLKAQIDFIIITPAYTYFVECKNMLGNLIINEKGDFIREYVLNGKKHKEGMYSPLGQAEKHIDIYKKIWKTRHNTITQKLLKDQFEQWNKPLVVLTNKKSIIDYRKAPNDIKNKIVRADYLVKYLKDDILHCNKDLLLSKEEMEKTAYTIMANYNRSINKNYYLEYKKLLENSNNEIEEKEAIRNKLLDFQKLKSKERNIPLDYIFTKDELDKIIEYLPKTKEQLIFLNILPEIRLKLHGDEIIKIINDNLNQ